MIVHPRRGIVKEAIITGPLEVSKVGLAIAAPLVMRECTRVLSRLDGEVQKSPCPFTFPQHEKKNLNFEIQPQFKEELNAFSLCAS
jgi:hypothetical protein